ncbi:MAG: ABC transporter substrate-binding protein [Dehalococcoidia bacterium]|nr:ABC transporter substrate-binding protein [Dehalococcoidia bacterium]
MGIDEQARQLAHTLDRRTVLRTGALAAGGLAAAALIGCGSDEEEAAPAPAGASGAGGGAATGPGKLVKDADLPYPYEYPDVAGTPKKGGTFVHASNFTFTPADPTVNNTGGTLIQFAPVYDRLLGYKMGPTADSTKVEVVPGLAETWERSPDGLTITFKLRGNVKWQNKAPLNGRAFTAADVKFAYDRMRDKGAAAPFFAGVSNIEAPDARTLKVTLGKPLVDWLTVTPPRREAPIFPKETVDDGSIAKTIIGTGAFMVDKQESERMSFVRNPDYWGTAPYLDGGEVRVMVDVAARVAALRAGQVDHAGNTLSSAREAKTLLDSIPGGQMQMNRVYAGGNGFLMNTENPKFKDERVRRALSLGMNRDEMIKIVFDGFARTHGFIPWPFIFDSEPKGDQLGKYLKYDPAEAKKLLEAAGAKDLVINEVHYDYLSTWKAQGETLVNQYKQIGVTLNTKTDDYTAYTSMLTGRKIPEATITGWGVSGVTPDPYVYDNLHSKSPQNRWLINDPKIDELADKQRVELNPQARRELIKQVYDRDLDMVYRFPFVGGNSFSFLQPWVRGMRLIGAFNSSAEVWDTGIQMRSTWIDK